jgi:hypothetical protein
VALVAALHVALLSAVDPPHDAGPRGAAPLPHAPSALQTRLLSPPPAGATPAPAIAPRLSPAAVAPTGRPRAAAPAAPRPAAADTAPQPVVSAPPMGDIPVYATQPPPAFAYSYALQRGEVRGSLELRWRPEGDRYEASLVGSLEGAPLYALHSVGAFDAAGLAPLRHTDGRRGRSAQAANFRRDEGRVTFSGPQGERALAPGMQDRLSWMLQLAAIAAADPSLVAPGGRISFVVVGVRGESDVWTFVHVADEALALAGGSVPATRLLRLPAHAYDTRAEVWLDPARHYLPLRVHLSNPPSQRDALQLEWREALATP